MEPLPSNAVELFISYAHEDERLCERLRDHLSSLQREGLINGWYDRDISSGTDFDREIIAQLRNAAVILLLVSPSFIGSEYINGVEVKEAMERHKAGLALVIPVILRHTDWESTPFGKLLALPTDARPVTSMNRDRACLDVVQGIRRAIAARSPSSQTCRGVPEIPYTPLVGFVPRKDKSGGSDLVTLLKAKLAPGKAGFIMLSGLEGVGKTKLAAEVARQLEADYKNFIVWSDAGRRVDYTIQSLLDDIATQLGHSDLRALAPREKEERVRSLVADHPTLFVLDSYEAIPEEELGQIDQFFKHARRPVLYISLRRKEDDDTTNVKVPPMWPQESDELTRRLVQLTQDPEVFTDILPARIHLVTDGRPALIEWIVRQIDAGPEEPDEVLRKVARGEGDVLQRVFSRSFELLGKDGRATLLALSLFPSTATREVLGIVVGLNEHRLREAIKDLRTLMLIEIETQDSSLRFTIKGITRKLAQKFLSADKRVSAKYWRNFVKYYEVQVDKYDWVRDGQLAVPVAEKSNILRAMQFASYLGEWDALMKLYCKTKSYFPSFNVWRHAIDLAEREAEEELGDKENLSLPIMIEIKHKDVRKVRKYYEELKRKNGKLGDKILRKLKSNASLVLRNSELPIVIELSVLEFELGVFAYHEGRYADAREHYETAKRCKELAKDWRGFATVSNNLGAAIAKEKNKDWVTQAAGELKEALKIFKHKKSNFTKVGSRNLNWVKDEARRLNRASTAKT